MPRVFRLFVLVLVVGVVTACTGSGATTTQGQEPTTTSGQVSTTSGPEATATSGPEPTTTTVVRPARFSSADLTPGEQGLYVYEASEGTTVEYVLFVPASHDIDREWPVIVSFHGFLGFDDSLAAVMRQNPAAWVDDLSAFPFVVVAPRAPDGLWSQLHGPMAELLEMLRVELSLDLDAVFLTGLSAGTPGVWDWATSEPDRFAGIAAVAGGAPTVDLCVLRGVPIWVGHGGADSVLPIEDARGVVATLESCGNTRVEFVVFEGADHHESIADAYAGPDLYDWMTSHIP